LTIRVSAWFARPIWTLLIAAVFAYSLADIAAHPLRIHADCALHIEAAEKILQGGLAGVDAVDTNPPLIMLITVIPTAFAHAVGAHPIPVFLMFTWLFTVVTTFAARQLFANALSARESIHADLLGLCLALESYFLQGDQYGQREYFFMFGVLPYLVIRFRRWEGFPVTSAAAIGSGVLAGITTSIKPQFAPIVAAPEIYWLITRRNWRAIAQREVIGAVAAAGVYLAYLTLIPQVRQAFFGRWVPLMVHGYAAYNRTYWTILTQLVENWRAAGIAVLPFVIRGRSDDIAWRITRPLGIATAMAAVVYFAQHKGYVYHALPLNVLAFVIAGLTLAQVLTRPADAVARPAFTGLVPARMWIAVLGGLVGLSVLASTIGLGASTRDATEALVKEDPLARGIAALTKEGDGVLLLSTDLWRPYPVLVQLGRHQASRTLYTFPVALLYYGVNAAPGQPFPYRGVDGAAAPSEEQRYLEDLAVDIRTTRPKVIMIDGLRPCIGCPDGFSMVEYFDRTGFTSALPQYSRAANLDRFVVYLRRD